MSEEEIVEVGDVTNNEKIDDYLNEMLTESQEPDLSTADEFKKNKEGVTGDEWEDEEFERLHKQIKEEQEAARREENKKNAERRIRNKKKKEEPIQETEDEKDSDVDDEEETQEPKANENLDKTELEFIRQRNHELEEQVDAARPVMEFVIANKLDKDTLQMAADFANHWKADPIGHVKRLLTFLEDKGINIGQILSHDDVEMKIRQEVDRRVQPYMQRNDAYMYEQQSRKMADDFINQYPDAIPHMEEIVEVMRRNNDNNPHKAYFNLRRAYEKNGQSWFPQPQKRQVQEEYYEEPEPMISSHNVSPVDFEEAPSSEIDLIRRTARNYFNRR